MADTGEPKRPGDDWAEWLDAELAKGRPDSTPPDVAEPEPAAEEQSPVFAPRIPDRPVLPPTSTPPPPPPPTPTLQVSAPTITTTQAVPPSTELDEMPDPSRPPVRATAALEQAAATTSPTRKRVSRWDRPPEPHDWRWVVGHIGRALITLGLLMFGFVAYQLWGTGIQTARAQHKLETQFENKIDELEAAGITPDTFPPETTTTTVTPTTVATTVAPGDTSVATTTTLAPETTTTVPSGPVEQDYGLIKCGDGIGKITIPKIDINFYYVACVGKDELNRGVGHFPKSVVPGQLGNAALAGHRTSHKAPFGDLDELEPGDVIKIETILGGAYSYVVTGSEVVDPSDYHVVTDSDPTKATLTLITCTPKYTSKQRLVVHADLDPSLSGSAVGIGEIYYGEANPDASLGNDTLPDDGLGGEATTTVVPTTVAPPTTVVTETTIPVDTATTPTTAGAAAATVPETTTTTLAPATPATTALQTSNTVVDVENEFAEDAFQQGWFDDSAAIPHVIGWAALFGLVWYGAYRFAKRFRNMWLGILIGIAPFVVVLYFFYENVNRLLPAAI